MAATAKLTAMAYVARSVLLLGASSCSSWKMGKLPSGSNTMRPFCGRWDYGAGVGG